MVYSSLFIHVFRQMAGKEEARGTEVIVTLITT
jgi:hypothetical protein